MIYLIQKENKGEWWSICPATFDSLGCCDMIVNIYWQTYRSWILGWLGAFPGQRKLRTRWIAKVNSGSAGDRLGRVYTIALRISRILLLSVKSYVWYCHWRFGERGMPIFLKILCLCGVFISIIWYENKQWILALCALLWLNMISAYFPKLLGWNVRCLIIRTVTWHKFLISRTTVRLPFHY